jgi:hypothetical protein
MIDEWSIDIVISSRTVVRTDRVRSGQMFRAAIKETGCADNDRPARELCARHRRNGENVD